MSYVGRDAGQAGQGTRRQMAAATAAGAPLRAPTSQVCPLRWWSRPVRLMMQHSRRSSSLAAATVAFLLGVLVICGEGSRRGQQGQAGGLIV